MSLSTLLIEQEIVKNKEAKPTRKALQLNSLLDMTNAKRFLIMKRPKNEISIRSQLNEVFLFVLLFVPSLYVLLTRSMSRHVLFKLEPTALSLKPLLKYTRELSASFFSISLA